MARTTKPDGARGPGKTQRPPIRKPNGDVVADDAIAKRAYEIYQARGGEHGADFDDWLEAERQIKQEQQFQTGQQPPPAQADRRKRSRVQSAS
jgi:hypothetical protein